MSSHDLARKTLEILRRERAPAGFHIREQWLADKLGVSRSPVRTALRALEQAAVVRSEQKKGYFLRVGPDSEAFTQIELPLAEPERLYRLIAGERFAKLIGEQVSAGDLMRRYQVSRSTIQKVLAHCRRTAWSRRRPATAGASGRRSTTKSPIGRATASAS